MIAIASDHGGYDLKERVKKYLEEKNIPYQDMGCDSRQAAIILCSDMQRQGLWQTVPARRAS